MKVNQVKVTSNTTMMDSLTLRKELRQFPKGEQASFTPGVGAWPPTRPGYSPAQVNDLAVHPLFPKYIDILLDLYYCDKVPTAPSSYGIRKEAKIGLPYNSRDETAHQDFLDTLMNEKLDLSYAGHYLYGSRIQVDSSKVRFTGFVQLKAIGDGFQSQRHRMINAGPACNHLLAIYEYDYHHHLLDEYGQTFNVVVDKFKDTGVGFAIDYKNYERSLGWDILFEHAAARLEKIGRPNHARLFKEMNYHNHIHFTPCFKNDDHFESYLRCGRDKSHYMNVVKELYGTNFHADELVDNTMKAIVENEPIMRDMYMAEKSCPKDDLTHMKVWTIDQVQNSSGVATTATMGKLFSVADTMCRLTDAYNWKFDHENTIKLLKHMLPFRIYNLGDDNLFVCDKMIDIDRFLAVKTGVKVEPEEPVGFLSRILYPETSPHIFKNAILMPQAGSFYRKLSRERDIFKYKKPSLGLVDSLNYARRNVDFAEIQREVSSLYARHYMSIDAMIDDLKHNVDQKLPDNLMKYVSYIDDPGKIYRDNIINPADMMPQFYYSVSPENREKVYKLNGI